MKTSFLRACCLLALPLLFSQCQQTAHKAVSTYRAPTPAAQRPIAPPHVASHARPSFSSPSNIAPHAPDIRAVSYILVNPNSGWVLAARNADARRVPASTQKILTALIIAEAGDLDRMVTVQASDLRVEPTKLGLKAGERYSRRNLLRVLMVKSANDVANVLARDNAGSIHAFAQKMNIRAHSLGCTSSNFTNPHGLTASGQYSTARDIARISAVAYRNPIIRDAIRRNRYQFTFNNGRTITLENTNKLMARMLECNGMKTGYTNAAGRCLVSTAHRNNKDVILVQLGTRTVYIWDDGETLMRWGLNQNR